MRDDPQRGELSQQLRGEVQPGSGRRHGDLPIGSCVDGLVASEVRRACRGGVVPGDVRGERHVADFVGESDHRALPGNSGYHPRRALRVLLQHLRFEVITLTEPRPDRKAFAGAEKAPPDLGFAGGTEQQALHLATRGAGRGEPRGQDRRVIAEEGVARPQQRWQV